MEILLVSTEGRGGEARVSVNGVTLAVVDAWSAGDAPAQAGPLPGARLEVVAIPRLSALASSEAGETGLQREWGWRYRARAKVVSCKPLRVDLGPFRADLDLPLRGGLRPGDPLDLAIDRIILSRG